MRGIALDAPAAQVCVYTFAAKNLALQGKDGQWPLEYYPNLNTPALEAGDDGKGLLIRADNLRSLTAFDP